jgi:hypothetical protein
MINEKNVVRNREAFLHSLRLDQNSTALGHLSLKTKFKLASIFKHFPLKLPFFVMVEIKKSFFTTQFDSIAITSGVEYFQFKP